MSKNLVSKKKLAAGINKAFLAMEKSKKDYVFSVINLGERLLEAKEYVGFGKWDEFINTNSEFAFDIRQAQKYMQIASHKDLVISLFGNHDIRPSINKLAKAISTAKAQAGTEIEVTIDEATVDAPSVLGQEGQEEILEGEYTEVEPEPARPALPEPELLDDEEEYSDDDRASDLIDDLIRENQRLEEDNNRMRVIFEDDNYTAAAIKQIDALKEVEKGLQGRIDGLLNENAEMKRQLNRLDRRCKILEKKLKESGHE
ncbi:DUF3102 domain-containing protein [Methylobacter luteus]|uniref:DUF3102 domain-containing protein n=1 Tax=Methylobacter luteus TaxID=415 RepID=UPI0004006F7A|nr:DUF3102 domain-containing protein [Methylobacter luteus]